MQRDIPIGLGAGLAAAILALAPVSGSGFGILLSVLSALPITLVTLCWGYRAGLITAIAAMAVLALVASGLAAQSPESSPLRLALQFGVSRALPAWGLAYLAVAGFGDSTTERAPLSLGTLAIVAAVLGMAGTFFGILALGSTPEQAIANLRSELMQAYRIMVGGSKDQPLPAKDGVDPEALLQIFSAILLPLMALSTTVSNLGGLWLSARIARISGRLPRPWPDVAAQLRLPTWSIGLLAVSCVLSLLPGTVGFAGQLLLAALLGAFLIQGFAAVHFLTRGGAVRPLILTLAYLLCLFLSWIALPLIIMLGLVETFLNLRGRFGDRSNTPSTPR
ncbi:DUF2232 domain-containing protein [Labrys sp. KNU-23]|uniref:DUF2232 domain-containing protein n=1 Tax=Labrys sp. KNU-23 TaxID=2789216 RepID=UPI0011EE5F6C|nr:DUF2232 domain-containing protein [Labrys sp. KNU-23]QEN91061.1 DUF2232 domain-containing protein [Labrys sp. KNU-23]